MSHARCPGDICRHGHGDACKAVRTGHHRFCELTDPDHPDFDARYIPLLTAPEPEATPPTLLDKAVSFAGAAIAHAAAGFPTVDEAEKARRLAICGGCEHFNAASTSCNICGCALKLKTSWSLSVCADRPPRW